MSSSIKFVALAALFDAALAAFGPAFSSGPVANGAYIIDAISTLVVPEGNSPFAGDFSLWCGMGTSAGDLIQSIVNRTPNNSPGTNTPCETVTTSTEWCGFAYTLFESGEQDISTQARINTGDHVQFHYIYNSGTGNYTQYLSQNGNVVSTLSTSDGQAQGWGTATECADDNCGTFPAHQWINTVITLSSADPGYGSTQGQSGGTTNSGFTTSDGGVSWEVSTINIPSFTY
ncbi:hypothetical protein M409DRAFT_27080 [Zasmidium cellare ATCC 36951]|uniref:Uncharacterized protein n=1 Tax=Zasmidium cellare ATCC 36951 TaxID=1080233 RepID=A0A6A6CAH8_ZASCE|nr:uncharacterized protein M409DRAFT_27080 [Zasmidium cellare ATCC 36951]KAF2162456.1 hypothetical protein M409DRAFT_27080 [Zasmidium cellare ATCC 36951]